jgi:ubiquinone biosynthesis protein UbiJ
MFKAIATRALQHIITQNSWANSILQPFAGRSVQFNLAAVRTNLVILEDGSLALAGETNVADASINISLPLLLRLLAKDDAAKLLIRIDGDTHLATELAKVLANLKWDYSDDLSKVVGDVPAQKIDQLSRHAATSVKNTGVNLVQMLSEYWQEEQPLIAKKRHVEQFNTQVDTLRADIERFEKRLAKLTTLHTAAMPNSSTPNNTQSDSAH